ncbi:hypothetical protein D3C86_1592570 [compost metagenome]
MQIENRQARVAALGLTGRKKTAAIGKRQQVTDLGMLPGTVGNTRGQYLVKQKTAGRGQQARTHIALLRQSLARGPGTGVNHVAAIMPETLGTEIIGNALLGDQLQARLDRSLVAGEPGQTQRETIGRVRTALQLAFVAAGLEDFQRVVFGCRQIRIGLARQLHAEPLTCQRLTILEPGIADRAQGNARGLGNPPCCFFSIQAALSTQIQRCSPSPLKGISRTSST